MSHTAETYIADAELAALLTAAHETGERVRVRVGEETYELEVKTASEWVNPYAGYSEEEVAAILHERAGIFTEEEAERIIKMIYEARERISSPNIDCVPTLLRVPRKEWSDDAHYRH